MKVAILGALLLLSVYLGFDSVTATTPSGWSTPSELARGDIWHPQIVANQEEGFTASWDDAKQLNLLYSGDGVGWSKLSSIQSPKGRLFDNRLIGGGKETFRFLATDEQAGSSGGSLYLYSKDGLRLVPFTIGSDYGAYLSSETIYLAWRDNFGQLFFTSGAKDGTRWEKPRVSNDKPGKGTLPVVWSDGKTVIVFLDSKDDGVTYSYRSKDSGKTWERRLIGLGMRPRVAVFGLLVTVILTDQETGTILSYGSGDLGKTWATPSYVARDQGVIESIALSVRESDGFIIAAWATPSGVFSSHGNGKEWSMVEMVSNDVTASFVSVFIGQKIFGVSWWGASNNTFVVSTRPAFR